jgi:hypothetical protein
MDAAEKGELADTADAPAPPPPDVADWRDPEPPRRDHRRSVVTGY